MLDKEPRRNWIRFYNSARDDEALDARTTVMVQLAAAMSLGCDP